MASRLARKANKRGFWQQRGTAAKLAQGDLGLRANFCICQVAPSQPFPCQLQPPLPPTPALRGQISPQGMGRGWGQDEVQYSTSNQAVRTASAPVPWDWTPGEGR